MSIIKVLVEDGNATIDAKNRNSETTIDLCKCNEIKEYLMYHRTRTTKNKEITYKFVVDSENMDDDEDNIKVVNVMYDILDEKINSGINNLENDIAHENLIKLDNNIQSLNDNLIHENNELIHNNNMLISDYDNVIDHYESKLDTMNKELYQKEEKIENLNHEIKSKDEKLKELEYKYQKLYSLYNKQMDHYNNIFETLDSDQNETYNTECNINRNTEETNENHASDSLDKPSSINTLLPLTSNTEAFPPLEIKNEIIIMNLNEINDDIEELKIMLNNNKEKQKDIRHHLNSSEENEEDKEAYSIEIKRLQKEEINLLNEMNSLKHEYMKFTNKLSSLSKDNNEKSKETNTNQQKSTSNDNESDNYYDSDDYYDSGDDYYDSDDDDDDYDTYFIEREKKRIDDAMLLNDLYIDNNNLGIEVTNADQTISTGNVKITNSNIIIEKFSTIRKHVNNIVKYYKRTAIQKKRFQGKLYRQQAIGMKMTKETPSKKTIEIEELENQMQNVSKELNKMSEKLEQLNNANKKINNKLFYFQVTPSNKATIVGLADKSIANVYIPQYLVVDGEKYYVNEIGHTAFCGSSIKSVTIGSDIESIDIDAFAFSECWKLETFTINAQKVNVDIDALYDTNANMVIKGRSVPAFVESVSKKLVLSFGLEVNKDYTKHSEMDRKRDLFILAKKLNEYITFSGNRDQGNAAVALTIRCASWGGISRAYYNLAIAMGIKETEILIGGDCAVSAWNYAKVDGKWYNVDVSRFDFFKNYTYTDSFFFSNANFSEFLNVKQPQGAYNNKPERWVVVNDLFHYDYDSSKPVTNFNIYLSSNDLGDRA